MCWWIQVLMFVQVKMSQKSNHFKKVKVQKKYLKKINDKLLLYYFTTIIKSLLLVNLIEWLTFAWIPNIECAICWFDLNSIALQD